MSNETTTERIERAANHIKATKVDDENYVYYADEVLDWYLVEAASLDGLGLLLEADDDDVRRDAYSHWCSGPDSGEPLQVSTGDYQRAIEAAKEVIGSERATYEVDEAMMGETWCGDKDALRAFCETLQGITDEFEIVAITDTYNGARYDDPNEGPTEEQWNAAIDQHAKASPDVWDA
jgi:hypothetical protein